VRVVNVHERALPASTAEVGALLDTLASPRDCLWPRDRWPAMRLDRPLGAGASGGHGPVRYVVDEYWPGERASFRFTRPVGFHGYHAFLVRGAAGGATLLRHELIMRARGPALLTWPLVFRPLHDALIEDALDMAAVALGQVVAPRKWSRRVRVLRWLFRRGRRLDRRDRGGFLASIRS
jgi:hypothetical protein